MRTAFILAPLISVLLFCLNAKAETYQALNRLLDSSDKVAVCTTERSNPQLITFYVHKVNPMIVAEFSGPQNHYYAMTLSEDKNQITLSGDQEIISLAFDIYFKTAEEKFTATFEKNGIRDPAVNMLPAVFHFEKGQTLKASCKKLQ